MRSDRHDLANTLRRSGLRVTPWRLAVLASMADCPPHADADMIAAAVRDRIGDVSAQTVYNVLRSFVAAGIMRRIEPAGSPGLYELRVRDNHHHIVCRRCSSTIDVDCVVGTAPCLEPSQTGGYLIDEAEVTFWGLCPRCGADGEAAVSMREKEGTRDRSADRET